MQQDTFKYDYSYEDVQCEHCYGLGHTKKIVKNDDWKLLQSIEKCIKHLIIDTTSNIKGFGNDPLDWYAYPGFIQNMPYELKLKFHKWLPGYQWSEIKNLLNKNCIAKHLTNSEDFMYEYKNNWGK